MARIDRWWEQNEAGGGAGRRRQTLIALCPSPHDHSLYWHRAYSASKLWMRDWRLWCMVAENSQFHQWVSDFNSWCVAFSSHVGDTGKRLPGLSVGPPRSMSATAGCLLTSALSRRNWWAPIRRRNSRWSTITPGDCSACQSLYVPNSGCWRNAPVLLQTQLKRIAKPRGRRDHQQNVRLSVHWQRTAGLIIHTWHQSEPVSRVGW